MSRAMKVNTQLHSHSDCLQECRRIIHRQTVKLVLGIKNFNQYLYGKHSSLVMAYQPFVSIFNPQMSVPLNATA